MPQPGVLILAGGMGRRCGGLDKGWMEIDGEALVTRRLRQLSGSDWPIAISANRSLVRYRALGVPIFVDRQPGFEGPLAAIAAALNCGFGNPLITVPVDTLDVALAMLQRLLDASGSGTRAVYACDTEGAQPLVAVWPRAALEMVDAALCSEQRAVRSVQASLGAVAVEFPGHCFGNINSSAEFEALGRAGEAASAC